MATAETLISLADVRVQTHSILYRYPNPAKDSPQAVPADELEIFKLFAAQQLRRRLGRDYFSELGAGTWPATQTDYGQISVKRVFLDPKDKFEPIDPTKNYHVTLLRVSWSEDQEEWSLEVTEHEPNFSPALAEVNILSPKGSARFKPKETL